MFNSLLVLDFALSFDWNMDHASWIWYAPPSMTLDSDIVTDVQDVKNKMNSSWERQFFWFLP